MNALNYQATKNYQKVQVESASPEKLVLMLYDGAIRKLGQAEAAFREDKVEEFHEHVVRVQKIVSELLGALDADKGGDLAENLERLYDYMLRQLSLALVRKNLDQVEEVKILLSELREGWKGVVENSSETRPEGADLASILEPTPLKVVHGETPRQEPVSSLNISG